MFFTSKRKKFFSIWLAFALVLAMLSALPGVSAEAVSQSELNALKQQQADLSEQKAGIQAQMDALNDKVASQTEKLDLLTEQLNVTNSEMDVLSEQIALYTASIAQMENQLTLDKEKKQELLESYKTHIRAMEENGTYSYMEILLGASSLEDLLCRIDLIGEIMGYYDGLVKKIQQAETDIQTAKTNMETEMAGQEEVFAEYQAKQADLATQQAEVEAVLASLTSDSEDYKSQLESVATLQTSIGGQISDMEDKLAELERIRAEQAAASQISSGGGSVGWYSDSVGTATGQEIVDYAETFLGVPYVYGGTSPSGFDCSGLVYYCYTHFGYSVNRTAAGLAYSGRVVSSSDLQPGDIILFTSTDGSYIGHAGIYIGGGQFIHAPHTGDVVKISSLSEDYYASHYWGARRVVS
jgi:cell wall-associated NlpC family hydrolase